MQVESPSSNKTSRMAHGIGNGAYRVKPVYSLVRTAYHRL